MTQYTRRPIFGMTPVNNPLFIGLEETIRRMEAEGWKLVTLIPGVPHAFADHTQPTEALFSREGDEPNKGEPALCSYGVGGQWAYYKKPAPAAPEE